MTYDVVVIGGGPAGLSGAVALGRALRSVLVIDSGEGRNAPAEGIHIYLTRDGMSPEEFRAAGRAEVLRYGGEVIEGRVVSAESAGVFTLRLEDVLGDDAPSGRNVAVVASTTTSGTATPDVDHEDTSALVAWPAGQVTATFSVPVIGDTLDEDNVEAEYEAGVLTLRIPIAERAKPRKVEIRGRETDRVAIDA